MARANQVEASPRLMGSMRSGLTSGRASIGGQGSSGPLGTLSATFSIASFASCAFSPTVVAGVGAGVGVDAGTGVSSGPPGAVLGVPGSGIEGVGMSGTSIARPGCRGAQVAAAKAAQTTDRRGRSSRIARDTWQTLSVTVHVRQDTR